MHPSRMQKGMASRGSPGMTWSKSCTCIQLPHRWFWGIQIYQYITFCWIYHSTRDSGLETKQHANHSNCFFPGISPLEESPNLHTGKRNLIRGWYIHGRQTEGLNQLQDWHDISTCWITQSLGYLFGDSSAFLLLSGNSASHSGWLVLYTEWASQDTFKHDKPVDPYWISIPELWNQAIMASSLEDICASSGVDPSLCNELIQEGWTAEAFDLAAPDLGSFDHFGRAFPIH